MTRIRTLLVAATLALTAAPAFAGGISIDLPRLQFPADDAATTRSCQSVITPVCAPNGK